MSEIITPLVALQEGISHTSKGEEYVITENHSISDVIRFLIEQSDIEDIKYIVDHFSD